MTLNRGTLARLAPAKVNLYLHVAAPDARRYHPLQSLVMFAEIGDEVRLGDEIGERGEGLTLSGPFCGGLTTGDDNLIVKAVRCFEAATGIIVDRQLHLTKNLPVASGLGGGSADAGAVLHLLRETYAPDLPDSDLEAMAASLGADGAMCLWGRSAFAEGYGEVLTPAAMPHLPCVLINPGVACATADVYAAFDHLANFKPVDVMPGFADVATLEELIEALKATRNDLEPAAIRCAPVIADFLSLLSEQPETLLARMSGSGATCFAICESQSAAKTLGDRLEVLLPRAWIAPCVLR